MNEQLAVETQDKLNSCVRKLEIIGGLMSWFNPDDLPDNINGYLGETLCCVASEIRQITKGRQAEAGSQ